MAKKTRERALSDQYVRVEYGLQQIGDERPYFSVQATTWNSRAHARRWPDKPTGGGAMHEVILRAFPDMADIVALHLSDTDGVPMHAAANGWYWYGRGEMEQVARHLRVAVEDLPKEADVTTFAAFVDAQRERWAAEAKAVRAKYEI